MVEVTIDVDIQQNRGEGRTPCCGQSCTDELLHNEIKLLDECFNHSKEVGVWIDYADLLALGVSRVLMDCGITRGDRVAIRAPNWRDWIISG